MICLREPKDRNVSKYIKYGEHVDQEKKLCTLRQLGHPIVSPRFERGFDDT